MRKLLAIDLSAPPPKFLISVACAFGWHVRIYDFDFSLRTYPWLQRLEAKGKVERVLLYPLGDAHTRAIEWAVRVVDAGVGKHTARILAKMFQTQNVDLIFKRILAERLARQFLMLDDVAKFGSQAWIYSPSIIESETLLRIAGWKGALYPKCAHRVPSVPGKFLIRFLANFVLLSFRAVTAMPQLFYAPETAKAIKIAWSISSQFQLRFQGARSYDFIIDDDKIKREDVTFFWELGNSIPAHSDPEKRQNFFFDVQKYGTIRHCLSHNVSGPWVRRVLGSIPLLMLTAARWQYTFQATRIAVSSFMHWSMVLTQCRPEKYVYTNKEFASQIACNLVLEQHGVETISYTQFIGGPYQLKFPPYDKRNVYWSFTNQQVSIVYNKAMCDGYSIHYQRVRRYEIIGSPFAGVIAVKSDSDGSAKFSSCPQLDLNSGEDRFVIAIFDTTFLDIADFVTDMIDGACFMDDIIALATQRPDWRFLFKPSKDVAEYENPSRQHFAFDNSLKLARKRQEMASLRNICVLQNTADPVDVIAFCDVTVTHCFSSPTADAASAGKSAFWYESSGKLKEYPLAQVPGMYVAGREALLERLQAECEKRFIRPESTLYRELIEPYGDCKGLERFRENLRQRQC